MDVIEEHVTPGNYTDDGIMKTHNQVGFSMIIKKCALLCSHRVILSKNGLSFLDILFETTFSITSDCVEEMKTNGKLEVPKGFLTQCGSLSYGTLRGVILMIARREGLENIIIPPAYINEFIAEPLIVDLQDSK